MSWVPPYAHAWPNLALTKNVYIVFHMCAYTAFHMCAYTASREPFAGHSFPFHSHGLHLVLVWRRR